MNLTDGIGGRHRFEKTKDGSFKGTLELGAGEYQFKYILDDAKWENDWEADKYVPAGVDATAENSVVVL